MITVEELQEAIKPNLNREVARNILSAGTLPNSLLDQILTLVTNSIVLEGLPTTVKVYPIGSIEVATENFLTENPTYKIKQVEYAPDTSEAIVVFEQYR